MQLLVSFYLLKKPQLLLSEKNDIFFFELVLDLLCIIRTYFIPSHILQEELRLYSSLHMEKA